MRDILNKFEGRSEPAPARRERLQSSLDAPRAALSAEASRARVQSISILKERANGVDEDACRRRYVPKISATDGDDIRDLKRQIQGKEQEIMEMASKLLQIGERLERVVDIFNTSLLQAAEAAVPVATEATGASRTRAFETADAAAAVQTTSRPKSLPSAAGTSLEAILAAARSSAPRSGADKPKYSRMLRDMK